MSLQEQVDRLYGVRDDIFDAIEEKGVTVPSGSVLADVPGLIASITGGGGGGGITGFEVKMIAQLAGIYLVDRNGYIGLNINDYFSQNGSPYPGNYAVVLNGADFSAAGLGRVTFLEFGSENIGGRVYKTVTIGGVTWMAENLDWKAPGITIGQSSSQTEACAAYYNGDEETYGENGNKYGLLYNWPAAMALTVAGWHLPTKTDWDALIETVGTSPGRKLKSTTGWAGSSNGTDEYGFSAVPAGYLPSTSSWSGASVGSDCRFWMTYSGSSYYERFSSDNQNASYSSANKALRISVRLVKDAPGDALTPYENRGIGLSASNDNSGRSSVPDSKNQSLFVVVPGVAGKVITAFDVWTDQPNAASVYKQNEIVAGTFSSFDFLGHDPTVAPQQVLAHPPSYAASWTTTQESDGSYKQHIVLDSPITMESGKQYCFIVTTRGDVDHTNCVCSSLVSAQNLMLSSTEWYEPSPQYDPPAIVFSWWEANKFCFAGTHAPSIKFYDTV